MMPLYRSGNLSNGAKQFREQARVEAEEIRVERLQDNEMKDVTPKKETKLIEITDFGGE